MNKKYIIPFLLFGAVACQTNEEPIKVVVPSPKNTLNIQSLREFKSKASERTQVIAMFNKWGEAPAYLNINNLPDSLDIIVLKDNYANLDEGKIADLRAVQNKATKVLVSIDLQKPIRDVSKKAKAALKIANKSLEQKWAQAEKAKSKGEAYNEEDLKPASRSMVRTVMLNLKKQVYNEFKTAIIEKCSSKQRENIKLLKSYGYNGLSIKLPDNFEFLSVEDVAGLLKIYTGEAGLGKKFMLIIENPMPELRELVEKANILVMSKSDMNLISTFDQEAELWAKSAYAPSFSKLDNNLSKGFDDFEIFGVNGILSKDLYLAKWTAKNKKAIAIYDAEAYYGDIVDVNGYILPYGSLRTYINLVNAQ